ncbi:unnamed protein product [Mytilus coruscus]|uniref:Paraneoplastic antigen Ma-like C-terminal domain-containing protein n=1 Tax=Mytilus coruscus TaxID=42192 RepID=A0A6J8DEF7_MYTCO|nr:unnamed protein product [Mytilus coruscus]
MTTYELRTVNRSRKLEILGKESRHKAKKLFTFQLDSMVCTPIKGATAHTKPPLAPVRSSSIARVATFAAGIGNNTTVSCSNSSYAKPKIHLFSGEEKSEVSFDVWKFEVKCIIREGNYSDTILLQCKRGSLKGKARGLLLSLPDGATPVHIIEKLDRVYGNVFSSEALLQKFYLETQKPGQSVADYGMILADIAQKAVEKGQINTQAKNDMLRSKLWSGLRDPLLKNASRYKYDTVENFDQLLKEIRSIELNLSNYASGSENEIQHQPAVVEQSGIQKMIKSLNLLNTRMESFEGELKKLKDSKPDDTTSFSNNQFRGQGRGNYRGFNRRDEGFKRVKVSVEGQTRDFYRPENVPSPKLVDICTQSILAQRMIGLANESFVYINNTKCKALIDTGSMISTISEGYIEAKIKVDFVEQDFMVPLLVVSLTDYNKNEPIIIGTNVIRFLDTCSMIGRQEINIEKIPREWDIAFNSIKDEAIGQVYSTNKNPIKLKPLSVLNVYGLARSKTPEACTVVTENLSDDLSDVSACPRVVNVKGSTCRVPVRIFNMTFKAMVIKPKITCNKYMIFERKSKIYAKFPRTEEKQTCSPILQVEVNNDDHKVEGAGMKRDKWDTERAFNF